ncbi:MAG TPA: hypothetical protein VK845_16475 [Gemmatimonadales bacterium]|nr:hypothetical protein [Gemmatimonadales bacterium]
MAGLPLEHIQPEERLVDLLRVSRKELPSISDKDWELAGLGEYVEPYADDLMYLFEHGSDRDAWSGLWKTISPRPKNEEEWIDHLMRLTVNEFVTLAVAVRNPAA